MSRKFVIEHLNGLIDLSSKVQEDDGALLAFTKRITAIRKTNEFLQRNGDKEMRDEGTRYVVVTVVNAFESYFKDIIIQYGQYWNKEEFEKLVHKSTKEYEATLQKSGVKKEVLIAYYNSFQGIDQVERVFCKLAGENFMNDVANHKIGIDDVKYFHVGSKEDWRVSFQEIFQLRHQIVHEPNDSIKVSMDEAIECIWDIGVFVMITNGHIKDCIVNKNSQH